MQDYTVKARKRQGTESLDLTIPTAIVKEEGISPGDIFEVNQLNERGEIILQYKRVYKKK